MGKMSTEECEQIRQWWCIDGKSASEIAKMRGKGESRSVIIGHVHRRKLNKSGGGFSARSKPSIPKVLPPKAAAKPAPRPQPAPPPLPVEEMPPPAPASADNPKLTDLRRGCCKWPVGEATGADQQFCAEPCIPAATGIGLGPYCLHHGTPGLKGAAYYARKPKAAKDLERLGKQQSARDYRPARGRA